MQLPALPHALITTSISGIQAILIQSTPQHSTACTHPNQQAPAQHPHP